MILIIIIINERGGDIAPPLPNMKEERRLVSEERLFNPQNKLIASCARELGMTCEPLIAGNEDFLELSIGGRSIVINKSRSHKMTLMAGLLAKNKQATNALLSRRGLPVPEDIVVESLCEQALHFLDKHRKVTVKPLDLNRSVGVTLGVRTEGELTKALQKALQASVSATIQRHVEGNDYRALVIGGKLVGVLEYRPASVEGDGRSTLAQLIVSMNEAQLRHNTANAKSSFEPVDAASATVCRHLKEHGRSLAETVERGAIVELFPSDNVEAAAISETIVDRTAAISAENARIAVEAAQTIGVDVAGVDIRCRNIGLSLTADNGAILEVNALPDLIDPHLFLEEASPGAVKQYLQYLFE